MNAVSEMSSAATTLLERFDDDQRARVQQPFPSDDERRRWFYTPAIMADHGGLGLGRMTPPQQQACMRLAAAGLSEAGYVTASVILALENILDRFEGWQGGGDRRGRDPSAYSVTVFGEPGSDRWSWRFGGHHISLNFTIVGERLASTPLFFGTDPASSPLSDGAVFRPLGVAEDLARELVQGLDNGQREAAILAPAPPLDIVMGNRPRVVDGALPLGVWQLFREELPPERFRAAEESAAAEIGLRHEHLEALRYTEAPKGLAGAAMSDEQREQLFALVTHYMRRAADDISKPQQDALRERLDDVHFVWAGSVEPGKPHYYRVQAPRLLIEYDNVQRSANHAHSVMRDPEDDFGEDLLAQHHRRHHTS